MAEKVPQTIANHTRLDPLFHFFLLPLSLALFVWGIAHLVRHPGYEAIALAVLTLVLMLTIFKTRSYALKVQDRLIRLEEQLRLASLQPARSSVPELRPAQWVALRFASDAEFVALADKAAAGNLAPKQIKQAIQAWRPDYFRV